MKAAVRYYSRGGNVRKMADALARGANVEAMSVEDEGSQIDEEVEVLFIGGALYGYQLDARLKEYIAEIPEGLVGRAVCFGSSYLTRRPVYLIQSYLKERGIKIAPQAIYSRNKPRESLLDAMEYFAKVEVNRDTSQDGLSPYERVRAMKIAIGEASLEGEGDAGDGRLAEEPAEPAEAGSEGQGSDVSDDTGDQPAAEVVEPGEGVAGMRGETKAPDIS